jgi:hypothetical protein
VWHSDGVFENPTPEDAGCDLLLFRKPIIKPVHQDVRINESGHGCKDPLLSNPCLAMAVCAHPAGADGVRLPDRRAEDALLDRQTVSSFEWGLPESHLLPESIRSHHLGEGYIDRRSFWAL